MPQLSTPQGLLEKLRGLNFFWNKIVKTLCHIMLDVSLSSFFTYLHLTYLTVIYQFSGTTFQSHQSPFVKVNVNIPLVSRPICQLICIPTMLT